MVLPQVPRQIARGCRRQDEQGIDDHQAHPAHGQRYDDSDGDGKERFIALRRHAARGGQLRMHRRQHQTVRPEHPQQHDRQQHQRQQADLLRGDGEDIADEIPVEFRKAPPAERHDENAKRDGGGGKDADDGVRRLARPAADEGKQQREQNRQPDREIDRLHRAAEHTDGDARKAGMAQRVGEEAHFSRHDHRGQQAEQRPQQQNGQQRVLHEVHFKHPDAERV